MTEEELDSLIAQTIEAQQATSMKDMGKVMNSLRPLIAGRADPTQVSAKLKQNLLNFPFYFKSKSALNCLHSGQFSAFSYLFLL